MHLHSVLSDKRFKDVTFVLLHGGNPYVGETTYLASMFQNVNIDFTWISWMSPARFKPALAEWVVIVPHDRFCWGSDSGTPESICGIDGITREAIADVLEEMVAEPDHRRAVRVDIYRVPLPENAAEAVWTMNA